MNKYTLGALFICLCQIVGCIGPEDPRYANYYRQMAGVAPSHSQSQGTGSYGRPPAYHDHYSNGSSGGYGSSGYGSGSSYSSQGDAGHESNGARITRERHAQAQRTALGFVGALLGGGGGGGQPEGPTCQLCSQPAEGGTVYCGQHINILMEQQRAGR